jgi:glycosyltransferase involved in cell wall biosynthesis
MKLDVCKKYIKILVVLRCSGGIRTFCDYTYNSFAMHKYKFTFIGPKTYEIKYLLENLKIFDISFISIKSDKNFNKLNPYQIFKEIMSRKYDIIHSHGLTAGVYCSIPAYILKIPHVVTIHEPLTQGLFVGIKGVIRKILIKHLLPLIQTIHFVSNAAENSYRKLIINFLGNKNNHVVIRNGIETGKFLRSQSRDIQKELGLCEKYFLIGFFGRFMSSKGFRYLIDALDILVNEKRTLKKPMVIAVNDGGFLSAEKRRIAELGLNEYVTFMPFQPNVAPIIKGVDVVVMPSLWEGCGLLAMETLVSGVPFIGTDIPAIKEMLEGTPGKMVPTRDAKSLAEAINQEMLGSSRKEAEKYALSAAENFDVKKQAYQLQEIILEMFENNKHNYK